MKKLKEYLNKVSQHLYKIDQNGTNVYQKVIIENDDKFTVLKFNEEMELISEKLYNMKSFYRESKRNLVGPGDIIFREYIDSYLKNGLLFYKGSGNSYKITTVPHFKKFRKALEDRNIEKYLQESEQKEMA